MSRVCLAAVADCHTSRLNHAAADTFCVALLCIQPPPSPPLSPSLPPSPRPDVACAVVSPPPLPQIVDGNPCYEYVAYIVFPWFGKFEVSRNEKNGGNVTYTDLEQLKADYTSGALHPGA